MRVDAIIRRFTPDSWRKPEPVVAGSVEEFTALVKAAGVESVDGYVDAIFGKGSTRLLSGQPVGPYERFGVLEAVDSTGRKIVFKQHFENGIVYNPIYILDPGNEERVAGVRKAIITVDALLKNVADTVPGVSTAIKTRDGRVMPNYEREKFRVGAESDNIAPY